MSEHTPEQKKIIEEWIAAPDGRCPKCGAPLKSGWGPKYISKINRRSTADKVVFCSNKDCPGRGEN